MSDGAGLSSEEKDSIAQKVVDNYQAMIDTLIERVKNLRDTYEGNLSMYKEILASEISELNDQMRINDTLSGMYEESPMRAKLVIGFSKIQLNLGHLPNGTTLKRSVAKNIGELEAGLTDLESRLAGIDTELGKEAVQKQQSLVLNEPEFERVRCEMMGKLKDSAYFVRRIIEIRRKRIDHTITTYNSVFPDSPYTRTSD